MPAKAKTKTTKTKRTVRKTTKPKWTQEQIEVKHLLERELEGLIGYLHTVHLSAIIVLVTSVGIFLFGTGILFEDKEKALVAFLVMVFMSFVSAIYSALALRPWPLPRFLLPIDISNIAVSDLSALVKDPKEYLELLYQHTQALTDHYLSPKLGKVRNAIAILLFGMSTAIILAVALP